MAQVSQLPEPEEFDELEVDNFLHENPLKLESVQIKNFKAIHDSGEITLTPLSVFIGNNGAGKSSLIEALELLKYMVSDGLTFALNKFSGWTSIWYKGVSHDSVRNYSSGEKPYSTNPLSFILKGNFGNSIYRTEINLTQSPGEIVPFIKSQYTEFLNMNGSKWTQTRDEKGQVIDTHVASETNLYIAPSSLTSNVTEDKITLNPSLEGFINTWQFLSLNPTALNLETRTGQPNILKKDGENISEYLNYFLKSDPDSFYGLVETLEYVLPYAKDLIPTVNTTSNVFNTAREQLPYTYRLELSEGTFKIPSSMLSTGTLRLIGLLAVLRSPTPPSLILIEEIENGLDPKTIHLIVEEIRNLVERGDSQVIITTHSPYLLDLLDLSQIIVVERASKTGEVVFHRPIDEEALANWAEDFSPGRLYTMGKLNKEKED